MSIPPLARSAAATKSGRMIALIVNGETRRTSAATVADLVRELELDPAKVAVERNGTIAPLTFAPTQVSPMWVWII